ncbi:MAG TPA: hypothetical protein VFD32_07780 [Dehalococcoidia bacterium]|nr:hypothetical protein [Dehalococcoidia bacterium]
MLRRTDELAEEQQVCFRGSLTAVPQLETAQQVAQALDRLGFERNPAALGGWVHLFHERCV